MPSNYEDNVFVNCPFDEEYKPLFHVIIFAVHDAGFVARCSLEISDSSQNRFEKIIKIISECKYGIHDISRTELDSQNLLPRFNMPLELGIYIGATKFGSKNHRSKGCLILDKERYRFQKFISDIAGQDICSHNNNPEKAIQVVRDWLRTASMHTNIPGGATIYERYSRFSEMLPSICERLRIRTSELTFVDFSHIVTTWLKENTI